ncbi:hypothetical protein EVAR_12733_1 [Eumeta japonica]|uniref:Uncharacterized protein n=1 Tax=Eumeta variegata TaxID=151549 RepID=A0A4C1UNR7_EUMVA|nr:hypothetical protein EVAR_12733_1 [Eumeta japonica]
MMKENVFDTPIASPATGSLTGRGLFSLGKVLNFFPVGDELECAVGAGLARSGLCLNPYDCRQRDGRASGDCAKGLGVCCVFMIDIIFVDRFASACAVERSEKDETCRLSSIP